MLDIVFDDRNKQYGAYELRVTYPERIKKSLLFTFAVALLAFTGAALANSFKSNKPLGPVIKEVTLTEIDQDKPEPLPEPVKPPEPLQVQTERLTQFTVVDDNQVQEPPPSQDDLVDAKISDF